MWMLCWAAALGCGDVNAQTRGAAGAMKENAEAAFARNSELTELDAWLRRLVGRFRILQRHQPLGEVDCVGIGNGPGVHCIFRITPPGIQGVWIDVYVFGLDLATPGINYLKLNSDGTAEGGVAKLLGSSIAFRGDCPVVPVGGPGTTISCWRELRIDAPHATKPVRIRTRMRHKFVSRAPNRRTSIVTLPSESDWLLERVLTKTGP